jgi:hypothetical protein|nr:MAG TPA: hypothetical protein [Caudoviricetes sp.]
MSWLNYVGAGLGLAQAGTSIYGAYQGNKLGKQQMELARQQQQQAAQRDAERRAIYGDLEQNLARYYTNLTPEQRTNRNLDRYDKQFKMAQDKVQQNLAQRGLMGSGIEQETFAQMEQNAINDRLNIAEQAEQSVRNEQMGFLGYASGQGNIAAQALANANAQSMGAMANQQNNWNKIADMSGQSAGNVFSSLMYNYGRNGANMFGIDNGPHSRGGLTNYGF